MTNPDLAATTFAAQMQHLLMHVLVDRLRQSESRERQLAVTLDRCMHLLTEMHGTHQQLRKEVTTLRSAKPTLATPKPTLATLAVEVPPTPSPSPPRRRKRPRPMLSLKTRILTAAKRVKTHETVQVDTSS